MQSIQIDRYGGPEVIVRRDIPIPAVKPGEVLIRSSHAGVNFMDVHTRDPVGRGVRVGLRRSASYASLRRLREDLRQELQ